MSDCNDVIQMNDLIDDCQRNFWYEWVGSPVDTFFAAPVPASQIGALRTALRISRLHFFGDYLCGLTPSPYLHFDVRRSAYGSLLPEAGDDGGQTEELIAGADDIGLDEEDDEPAYESVSRIVF